MCGYLNILPEDLTKTQILTRKCHPPSRGSLTMVAIIDFFALKKLLNLQLILLHHTFNYIILY
jgi:hypothetical protein